MCSSNLIRTNFKGRQLGGPSLRSKRHKRHLLPGGILAELPFVPTRSAWTAAIRRASSGLILIKVQICQTCFKWRSKSKKNAPLSRDDLDNQIRNRRPGSSSKDLLEACVAFAYGAYFCHRSKVSHEVTNIPNRLTVDI